MSDVATKIAEIVRKVSRDYIAEKHGNPPPCNVKFVPTAELVADAILRSPDLRVTLVESRYFLAESLAGKYLRRRTSSSGDWFNVGFFYDKERAAEVCDWLNSKEPK